ncbi:hypothetical protein EMIT0232MI5_40094 [Pseudomonas sp. IT-232MI5]
MSGAGFTEYSMDSMLDRSNVA